jgi:hypothetical protein
MLGSKDHFILLFTSSILKYFIKDELDKKMDWKSRHEGWGPGQSQIPALHTKPCLLCWQLFTEALCPVTPTNTYQRNSVYHQGQGVHCCKEVPHSTKREHRLDTAFGGQKHLAKGTKF